MANKTLFISNSTHETSNEIVEFDGILRYRTLCVIFSVLFERLGVCVGFEHRYGGGGVHKSISVFINSIVVFVSTKY